MAVQRAQQTLSNNKKMKKEKMAVRGDALATEGAAKKDIDTEVQSKVDDENYLKEITVDCKLKAADFANRQMPRS